MGYDRAVIVSQGNLRSCERIGTDGRVSVAIESSILGFSTG